MSSLVRRMQRANKRRTKMKRGVGVYPTFGSKVGVHSNVKRKHRIRARGQRRGKHSKAWIEARQARKAAAA